MLRAFVESTADGIHSDLIGAFMAPRTIPRPRIASHAVRLHNYFRTLPLSIWRSWRINLNSTTAVKTLTIAPLSYPIATR